MVQQDEAAQQALSYIRHQAAKSLSDLRALMERTAADCDRCLEGVSEPQAAFKPAPQEWSATEVLRHLVPALEWANDTVQRLAAGEPVEWQPQAGGLAYERASFGELKGRLAQAWQGCLGVIDSLQASAQDELQVSHPFFGPLNWREWTAFQRLHALDHLQQIEKIKAEPSYPGA